MSGLVNAASRPGLRKTRRSGFWPRALAIASCALLAGCGEKMVPASVGRYNHMSNWSNAMRIDTLVQRMNLCELFWQQPELSNNLHSDHEALRALMA